MSKSTHVRKRHTHLQQQHNQAAKYQKYVMTCTLLKIAYLRAQGYIIPELKHELLCVPCLNHFKKVKIHFWFPYRLSYIKQIQDSLLVLANKIENIPSSMLDLMTHSRVAVLDIMFRCVHIVELHLLKGLPLCKCQSWSNILPVLDKKWHFFPFSRLPQGWEW